MWQCPRCGTTNYLSSPVCVVCGTVQAPADPTTVPVSVPPQQYPPPQYPPQQYPPQQYAQPQQQWSYDPYGQPVQVPAQQQRSPDNRRAIILAACIAVTVVLAIVAVIVIRAMSTKSNGPGASQTLTPPPTGTLPPTGSPGTSLPPTIPPTTPTTTGPVLPSTIGVVDVRPVATDPATPAVGQMFNEYFSGINDKNYPRALAAFDPAGALNTNDSHQVSNFEHGISTTSDSQVVLRSIVPDTTGAGVLDARVTFVSHQSAGFGPSAHPNQTCTRWDITYVLSQDGNAYLIFRAARFSNSGC